MAWLRSIACGAALSVTGCLGEPTLVDCADDPNFPGCESTSSSSSSSSSSSEEGSSSGGGELPPPGLCYREPSPLSVANSGSVQVIGNEWFELVLSADDNYMPRRLAVKGNGQNLLYDGMGTMQRLMGVQLHDASFSWAPGAMAPVFGMWEDHGAVVRFDVQWAAPELASGMWITSHYPTRYGITPDGRMTRVEAVRVWGDPQSGRWLSAYVGLNAAQFQGVDVHGDFEGSYGLGQTGPFYPADPENTTNLEPVVLCAYDESTGIAVGFGTDPYPSQSDSPTHPEMATYGWGLRGAQPITESISLLLDWGRDFTPDATAYHTHVFTMVTQTDAGDPCACMTEQIRVYVHPPALAIEGGTAIVGEIAATQEPETDRYEDGYFGDGGYYAIEASANPFTVRPIDTPLPTVLLRVIGVGVVSPTGFTARIDGVLLEDGVDYIATPSGETVTNGFYFFLARELPSTSTLSIEYASG